MPALPKFSVGLVMATLLSLTLPAAAQADHTAQAAQTARAFEVQVTGPRSATDQARAKADLIFVPGLASSREVWSGLVETLCQARRCHLLQLAGFAGTSPIAGALLAQTEQQLNDYIAAQHFKQAPIVIGHSLGGFLALKLAIGPDSLLERAIVIDALPALAAMQQPSLSPQQLAALATQMRAQMLAQDAADFTAQQHEALARMVTATADLARVRDAATRSNRVAVIGAMAEMAGDDLRPRLAAIARPVLVLASWAGYKPYADKAAIEGLFRQQYLGLAGVQIEMASHGLHFLMLDEPGWTLAQIERFLP